jgi:hypothetical protein
LIVWRHARVEDPGLLVSDGEVVCPVLDAGEFFSRNRLLMSIWLNFFGCGILSVVVVFCPFTDVLRADVVPATMSGLAGEPSLEAVGRVADDGENSCSAFVDTLSDFLASEVSLIPFTLSVFSMLFAASGGSVVAIHASGDAK